MEYCSVGSLYDVLQSRAFDFARSTPIRVASDIALGMAVSACSCCFCSLMICFWCHSICTRDLAHQSCIGA